LGIGFVLVLYFIALSVVSAIGGSILMAATNRYLNTVPGHRTQVARNAGLFPFACMVFAGIWFVGYATISDVVFHRDPMIGDDWHTNIGGGYAITMIDVTDQGVLHLSDGGVNGPGKIDGVRRMQIAGDQIFGARDTKSFQHFADESQVEDAFFALNTKSHLKQDFPTEVSLASYVGSQGLRLKMEPIGKVYDQFRFGWFDWIAGLLLACVPMYAFWLLLRNIRLIKLHGGSPSSQFS
jgi:hypothetical protein